MITIIIFLLIIISLCIIFYKYTYFPKSLYFKLKNNLEVKGGLFNYMYIYKEIFKDNCYNFKLDLNNSTILDIGTNIGLFSLWLNDNFKNLNVHCFEPIPELFNAANNNLSKLKKNNNNFYLNKYGLSDKKETKYINYYPYMSGLSTTCDDFDRKLDALGEKSIVEKVFIKNTTKKKEVLKIKLDKIKNYIKNNNIDNIKLCKIDVECSELKIMLGFEEYINKVEYYIIEVENFRENYLNSIKKLLKNYTLQIDYSNKNWVMIFAKRKKL